MTGEADRNVQAFWDWFSVHQESLRHLSSDPEMTDTLNRAVDRLGDFDWEIGPGTRASHFFALSPQGDKDSLTLTKRIIQAAPDLPEWEWLPAKPLREWNLQFYFLRPEGPVFVNGATWGCVIFRYPDGDYEVDFYPPDTLQLNMEDLELAAIIILDGELGEERRLNLVSHINIITEAQTETPAEPRLLRPGYLRRLIVQDNPDA